MNEYGDRRMYGLMAGPTNDAIQIAEEPDLKGRMSVWFFKRVSSPDGNGSDERPEIFAIQICSAEDMGLDQFKDWGDGNCYYTDVEGYKEMCEAVAALNGHE
jgi:hypothetical protein